MEEAAAVETNKKARKKFECPFSSCNAKVVHLPRHMRQVQGWDGVLRKGLRKTTKKPGAKPLKRNRGHKRRSHKNCHSVVRIHNHLKQTHDVKKGSKMYRRLLDAAKIYEPPVITIDNTSSSDSSESTDESESDQETYTETKLVKKPKRAVYEAVYGNEDMAGKDDGDNSGDDDYGAGGADGSGDDDNGAGDNDGDYDNGVCDGDYAQGEDTEDDVGLSFSSSINDKVILSNFHDWLKRPDGGRKDEKCSKQCARQVQMHVMQQINTHKQTVTDLLSKTTLRDKWLEPVEKIKQPGTVKSYLVSLNQFFIFLHAECCDQFEELNTTASQLVRLSE